MTADRKKQPVGAPDLKLSIADWGETHLTNKQASEDEISPRSKAVVDCPDLTPVRTSMTTPTPDWTKARPGSENAHQPDAHLNNIPYTTTTATGFIAEVRRAIREELIEVMRRSQGEGGDADQQRQGHLATKSHSSETSSIFSTRVMLSHSSSEATAEWGDLFTSEGHATPRFGRIMRVLSGHVVNKFGSENDGMVITPDGLRRFYVAYRLDDEVYPFIDIFSSKAPEIADFLLDMECQHHLTQQNKYSRPLVPALTVIGFAQYYMSCILAYPDTEFRRLEKIVADMPSIVVGSNAEGGLPEILPKVILRHQLPPGADVKSKQLVDGAFEDLIYDLELPPHKEQPPPPPPPPPTPSHLPTMNNTTTKVPAAAAAPEPNNPAAEKPDSASVFVPSRSTTRRKYAQPSLLHTIGGSDDDDLNANNHGNRSLDHESEGHRRERELERASMPGPRQRYARLHSWHAGHTGTSPAGLPHQHHHHHRLASDHSQRYEGRAGQPFSNSPATQADGGAVPPLSAAGPPRGSVSSNASTSGYWGHGGRTPPPTRQNSTSVPDVSSTGGSFSFSSSYFPSSSATATTRTTTPTANPVGSPPGGRVSPAASVTHQWHPHQYRPAAAANESSRPSSFVSGVERQEQQQHQKPHHVRWEGVLQQQQTSKSVSAGGGGQNNIKTERRPSQRHHNLHHGHQNHHHRRLPSSGASSAAGDDDDYGSHKKGETWEEFLRARKKVESYHQR